ncbi:MAG: hypothetical protein RMK52_04155 [Chitinophagales bacterium]|nr:hypothetical protein [Chitinophagales bacterium]MDW8393420.1 hypothetical protein [Chitinophagales bacterium]
MDARLLISLLADPARLHSLPVEQVQQWASRYPASFLMKTLLAARLKGTEAYSDALATASLLAADRGRLRDFMEQADPAVWAHSLLVPSSMPESGLVPDLTLDDEPIDADLVEPVPEQQSIMLIEEEFAEEATYERQEELLLVNELGGGGSEFLPTDVSEQPVEDNGPEYPDDAEPRTMLLLEQQPSIDAVAPEHETLHDADPSPVAEAVAGQPGQFLPDKVMPFHQWLKLFAAPPQRPASSTTPAPAETVSPPPAQPADYRFTRQHEEELLLIDHFMSGYRQPVHRTADVSVETLSRKSGELHEEIVSETLAAIYESQGLWDKAIRQYVRLSLKFPEKVAFFAARIRELKQKKS